MDRCARRLEKHASKVPDVEEDGQSSPFLALLDALPEENEDDDTGGVESEDDGEAKVRQLLTTKLKTLGKTRSTLGLVRNWREGFKNQGTSNDWLCAFPMQALRLRPLHVAQNHYHHPQQQLRRPQGEML